MAEVKSSSSFVNNGFLTFTSSGVELLYNSQILVLLLMDILIIEYYIIKYIMLPYLNGIIDFAFLLLRFHFRQSTFVYLNQFITLIL